MPVPPVAALQTFDAAARLGSFRRAAEELAVTPTAVSHRIRGLETQLGLALFVRRTRRIELTEPGAHLAEATAEAFSRLRVALEEIAEAEQVLTVSATPAFAALWLAPRIAGFERAHPAIRVRIEAGTAPVDLGRERRVDLAIRYGPAPPFGLDEAFHLTERFGAYGAPELFAGMTSFGETPLIETVWRERAMPTVSWRTWALRAGEDADIGGRLRGFEDEQHVLQAGLAGQGLVLASSVLVGDLVNRGWLVPYRPEITVDGFAYRVVRLPGREPPRKVQRFLAWLTQQAP